MCALLTKLVTNEDPLHLHKATGVVCLANFAAQAALYAITRRGWTSRRTCYCR